MGLLLSICLPAEVYGAEHESRILDVLRQFDATASILRVLPDAARVRLLITLGGKTDARRVARELLLPSNGHLKVVQAKLVDAETWARDLDLVQRIMQGCEHALKEAVSLFAGPTARSLSSRFGKAVSEQDVEEVISTATLKLWNLAARFDPDRGGLGTWFYMMAQSELLTLLRRTPPDTYSLEVEPGIRHRFSDGSTSHRTNQQVLKDLDEVIRALPRRQRQIIEADLACDGNGDDQKFAERLGIKVNALRVSRNKARKRIMEEMRKRGHDFDDEGQEQCGAGM